MFTKDEELSVLFSGTEIELYELLISNIKTSCQDIKSLMRNDNKELIEFKIKDLCMATNMVIKKLNILGNDIADIDQDTVARLMEGCSESPINSFDIFLVLLDVLVSIKFDSPNPKKEDTPNKVKPVTKETINSSIYDVGSILDIIEGKDDLSSFGDFDNVDPNMDEYIIDVPAENGTAGMVSAENMPPDSKVLSFDLSDEDEREIDTDPRTTTDSPLYDMNGNIDPKGGMIRETYELFIGKNEGKTINKSSGFGASTEPECYKFPKYMELLSGFEEDCLGLVSHKHLTESMWRKMIATTYKIKTGDMDCSPYNKNDILANSKYYLLNYKADNGFKGYMSKEMPEYN